MSTIILLLSSLSLFARPDWGITYVVKLIELFFTPIDDVIEIAAERDIYSVVEGNDLEVCVTVLSGTAMVEFEVIAHVYYYYYYKCKSLNDLLNYDGPLL